MRTIDLLAIVFYILLCQMSFKAFGNPHVKYKSILPFSDFIFKILDILKSIFRFIQLKNNTRKYETMIDECLYLVSLSEEERLKLGVTTIVVDTNFTAEELKIIRKYEAQLLPVERGVSK